jgi:hypothetical protein
MSNEYADVPSDTTDADEVPARVGPTDDVDRDELVGPGRYPLRIQPAAAIQPGEADAHRLLRIWFVRKSFYWMIFLGWTIGNLVAASRHQEPDFEVGGGSASPVWFLVLLALAIKFIVGWVALGMALPLALAHEPNLSPRENFGSSIGVFFDRLHLARAFRSLRWTHHVRQVAQHRLGEQGRRLGRLDPILDVINIASGVIAFLSAIVVVIVLH